MFLYRHSSNLYTIKILWAHFRDVYCLLNEKKHSKVWSKDLVYKKTIRLSSRTSQIQFNVMPETVYVIF